MSGRAFVEERRLSAPAGTAVQEQPRWFVVADGALAVPRIRILRGQADSPDFTAVVPRSRARQSQIEIEI